MSMLLLFLLLDVSQCCTDFYMNFTHFALSGRTLDLGNMANWTLSTWPVEMVFIFRKYSHFLYSSLFFYIIQKDLRRAKGFSNDPSVNEKTATLVNWSAKYGSIGLSANWLGDDRFLGTAFFGDSLNEKVKYFI